MLQVLLIASSMENWFHFSRECFGAHQAGALSTPIFKETGVTVFESAMAFVLQPSRSQ